MLKGSLRKKRHVILIQDNSLDCGGMMQQDLP